MTNRFRQRTKEYAFRTLRAQSAQTPPSATMPSTPMAAFDLDDFFARLTNPVWANEAHTGILLDGVINGEPSSFLASPNDPEPYGIEVYENARAGVYGPIGPFMPTAPPEPELPLPTTVSRRQFFQALAMQGYITQDEALAAMQGVIPARMDEFIKTLTPDEQFTARMILKGGELDRDHPLTGKFVAFEGMTDEQLDDLWALAASL